MKITDLRVRLDSFELNIGKLELEPGVMYGLIGPNGCGKTTLLNVLAGLNGNYFGELDFGGLTRRDVTLVSRKPYMLHASVYQNLVYPLKLRGIKPDNALVAECLEAIGFNDGRKRYAPALSSGEQQKLALMRALIFDPKLILIDEALSNLDIGSVSMFEELFKRRQEENPATWLIVSHNLSHIRRLCDRVLFMQNGVILAEGGAEEMLTNPSNTELAKYLRHEALIIDKSE